jgi:hypothetical protein
MLAKPRSLALLRDDNVAVLAGAAVRMANSRFLHYAVAGAPAPVGMTRGESRWRSGSGRNDKGGESLALRLRSE